MSKPLSWYPGVWGKACTQVRKTIEIVPGVKISVDVRAEAPMMMLGGVFSMHRYPVRQRDTGAYNCRLVTGGSAMSAHAYGVAVDVNWTTNPYIDHEGTRSVRWGSDTDMPELMIADVRKIKTKAGVPVFEWGGDYRTIKDCMHFQIVVSPAECVGIVGPDFHLVWAKPGDLQRFVQLNVIPETRDLTTCLRYQSKWWEPIIPKLTYNELWTAAWAADQAMYFREKVEST